MARPKPEIILEIGNSVTHRNDQILESNGIWAVYFDNKPFNFRNVNVIINYPAPKYKKVSFSNPGHAINLCKKLNKMFKTNKFSVVYLLVGKQIYP